MKLIAQESAAGENDWKVIDEFDDLRDAKACCSATWKALWQATSADYAQRARDYRIVSRGVAVVEARAPHSGIGLRWRK
jgi:hypothetical protein